MGLLKSLKKLSLKKAAKVVAKVAPIAAVLIPGVGPVVAGAIAVAGKVGTALGGIKEKIEGVQQVINGPPVQPVAIGQPVPSTGPSVGLAGFGGLFSNPLTLIVLALAAIFVLPKLFGRRR